MSMFRMSMKSAAATKQAEEEIGADLLDFDGFLEKKQKVEATHKEKERQLRQQGVKKESRYIANLKKHADVRNKEQEYARERVIQREQDKEAHLYGDKERFVTSAYKKKIAEDRKWAEDRRKEQEKETERGRQTEEDYLFNLARNQSQQFDAMNESEPMETELSSRIVKDENVPSKPKAKIFDDEDEDGDNKIVKASHSSSSHAGAKVELTMNLSDESGDESNDSESDEDGLVTSMKKSKQVEDSPKRESSRSHHHHHHRNDKDGDNRRRRRDDESSRRHSRHRHDDDDYDDDDRYKSHSSSRHHHHSRRREDSRESKNRNNEENNDTELDLSLKSLQKRGGLILPKKPKQQQQQPRSNERSDDNRDIRRRNDKSSSNRESKKRSSRHDEEMKQTVVDKPQIDLDDARAKFLARKKARLEAKAARTK
eukprot:TRINITY_DN411_c0_g1_i1.p1 TRINITY_DN411_c0_g1~~TRINITY_DN411_c0_g1_i1.p1  ORF type:complete len:427 (+),score=179.18 TRINITY_DN411_c0_g1_i1:88-1368(+)